MQYCPKCGANVEGLTHHCDCCGAILSPTVSLFTWHAFMMQGSGDLYRYANKVFCKLEKLDAFKYDEHVKSIEVNLYCYPDEIIKAEKIKCNVYYSKLNRKMRINLVVDYSSYVYGDSKLKEQEVINAVLNGIRTAVKKAACSSIYIEDLLDDVEKLIHIQ